MEILQEILNTYASFFDWEMWREVLTDPVSWGLIGTLVLLEGLLSADNALVLAVMVKHLPPEKRRKALTYGLIGAYFFRFLFIGIGMYLIKFWWIKLFGAAYLAWIVIQHFRKKGEEENPDGMKKDSWLVRTFGIFWATVISVELMDIAFSADSILAALAISEQIWVLLLGGMIGILLMRTVAGVFLKLIEKIPEMENTAFVLIAIIALKMFLSVFDIHVPHFAFFGIIVAAFLGTFVVHYYNNKNRPYAEETASAKENE
ncbi:TerC family protein [Pseudalkalibacillus hwajinpoensis]|uniref:TerC family protein n=1 Tax=Guptibacillus hwajinpoensis TaxID=208199 RepID=UPI00325BD92E